MLPIPLPLNPGVCVCARNIPHIARDVEWGRGQEVMTPTQDYHGIMHRHRERAFMRRMKKMDKVLGKKDGADPWHVKRYRDHLQNMEGQRSKQIEHKEE